MTIKGRCVGVALKGVCGGVALKGGVRVQEVWHIRGLALQDLSTPINANLLVVSAASGTVVYGEGIIHVIMQGYI